MIIRRAHTEDVKNIATLVMSLSHYYLPKQALAEELPKWFLNSLTEEQFLQRMNSNEYSNYVYCIDDEIVGYIAMKESSHLYHLFVSESHQGKGIASAMMHAAFAEAHSCPAEFFGLFGDRPMYAGNNFENVPNTVTSTQLYDAHTGEVVTEPTQSLMILSLNGRAWDQNLPVDLLGFKF